MKPKKQTTADDDFPYLTSEEAAQVMGLTKWAVQKMAQRKEIAVRYLGPITARFRPMLIHRDEITRVMKAREEAKKAHA